MKCRSDFRFGLVNSAIRGEIDESEIVSRDPSVGAPWCPQRGRRTDRQLQPQW